MTDPIASLRASHQRLRSVVEPLTAEQIRQPAYPSEWSIAQVLSHLGSGAEIGALLVQAGMSGSEPPSRDTYPAIWDRWNAKSPDEMVADGLASDARLVALIESLRDDRYADIVIQFFMGPVDRYTYAAFRLGEHAVHTWDVAVIANPAAQVAPDAVDLLIDRVPGFLGPRLGKPQDPPLRVHFTVTSPDRDWTLTAATDSVTVTDGQGVDDGGPAASEVRIPAEALLRLAYGRLDPAHTPDGVEADPAVLDRLRAVFPGF